MLPKSPSLPAFLFTPLVILLIAPVFGQTPSDTTVVEIEIISISQLTEKTQESNTFSRSVQSYLEDDGIISSTYETFREIEHRYDSIYDAIDTASMDIPRAGAVSNSLSDFQGKVDNLSNSLNNRTSRLEDYRSDLRSRLEVWEATFSQAVEDGSPPTALQNLNRVVQNIKSSDRFVVAQLDELFAMQNDIQSFSNRIRQDQQKVQGVMVQISQRLFRIDSPPIWKLGTDSTSRTQAKKNFVDNWRLATAIIPAYGSEHIPYLTVHILVVIFIIFLVFYLKRKQEKLIQYVDLEEFKILFKHPISLSLVVGILIFVPTYATVPEAILDFLLILVYLLVIRLLYHIINPRVRIWLIILGFFLVANLLLEMVPQQGFITRVYMLVQTALGIVGFTLILRFGLSKFRIMGQWVVQWMLYLIPVALAAFILSFITNVIGSTNFTEFLLLGSVRAIAYGISIFAAVIALNGIISILIRNPRAKAIYLVKEHATLIEQRLRFVVQLFFYFFWIKGVLNTFGVWDPVYNWAAETLAVGFTIGKTEISIAGILGFFLTVFITIWLARILRLILEKELFERMNLPRGIPGAISATSYYLILAFGFFIAVSQTGIDLSQVSLIVGALGVGIGFGLQNVISNFVSGIILAFERPVQEGDMVEVGQLMGTVSSIGIRSSKVRTFDGSEVIVPNNNLIANEVINWTLSDKTRRINIYIGVAYGTNPRRVNDILVQEANKNKTTLKEPEPMAIFEGFGDSSLNFRLMFWVYFDDYFLTKSEVSMSIYDALEKEGIEIPFPQRVVTMKENKEDNLTEDAKTK